MNEKTNKPRMIHEEMLKTYNALKNENLDNVTNEDLQLIKTVAMRIRGTTEQSNVLYLKTNQKDAPFYSHTMELGEVIINIIDQKIFENRRTQ